MTGQQTFEALGRRIAVEQDELLARADLDLVRQRVVNAALEREPKPRRRALAWAGGLAAAAAIALGVATFLARPGPLSFSVGDTESVGEVGQWVSAPAQQSVPIRFSDGTALVLDPGTRARVVEVAERGAHLVIESGRASVDVEPQPRAEWRLSTGPFSILVVGTEFSVAWDPDRDLFELQLHEGEVSVSGCLFGSGRSVHAGETLRASCRAGRFEVASGLGATSSFGDLSVPAGPKPGASAASDAPRSGAGPDGVAGAAPPAPSWRLLAGDGKYREAFAAIEEAGFEAECQRASAADLARLGDVARYAGQLGKAAQAYQLLRSRFAGSGRAAAAAYTLGRMAFDQQGDHGQAARWFQIYLSEQPGGGLAREALGRLMEASHRSGGQASASKIAAQYLKRYPDGPHARLARQLAAPKKAKSKAKSKKR